VLNHIKSYGILYRTLPELRKPLAKQSDFCKLVRVPSATLEHMRQVRRVGRLRFAVLLEVRRRAKHGSSPPDLRGPLAPLADDFAVQVNLSIPRRCFLTACRVDEGTLGLLFQDGICRCARAGLPFVRLISSPRLTGLDKGKEAHAILIDINSAEVDFVLEDLRAQNQTPIDVA